MATIFNVAGLGNYPATNELPVDMHKKQMSSYAGIAPLTVILGKLGEDKAHQFRIDWLEEAIMPTQLIVAVSEGSVGTSLTFTQNATSAVFGSLLFNARNNDIRRVSAAPTTQTLTVQTNQGGKTSTVWLAGDPIEVLLTDVPEDEDEVYRPASAQDTNVYNYIQLCRLQYSMTRIANASSTWFGGPGSKRNQLKTQKYREYREKFEKMIYFGGRATTGTAPASQYQMGGLNDRLRNGTLFKDFNGIFTESGLDQFLLSYKEQNPDAKSLLLATAESVMLKIAQFAKGRIRLSPNSKSYGMRLNEYIGPINVDLVPLPLLNNQTTRGWAFLLDLQRIKLKYLDKTMFFPDAKGVGNSERIYDLYRSVASLMVANEERHAMFVGATL